MTARLAGPLARLSVANRYAVRNLARNGRRTLLSVAGVAVGCTIALVNIGFVQGKVDLFLRSIGEGGIGHVRVVNREWPVSRSRELRLRAWRPLLAALRADPAVAVATPRTRVQGLLALGTRMAGAEVVGVDPTTEPRAYRYVRVMASGRYLLPADTAGIVIGRSLADRLGAEVGAPLVVTVVDRAGTLKDAMFDVVGIVDLGSNLDASICQVTLAAAERLSGTPGAGEISLLLRDPARADRFRAGLQTRLSAPDTALTWAEINPPSAAAIRINQVVQAILTTILVLVALLGVASSQLTAVLERRREFAVLAAIGTGRLAIFRLLLGEAVAMGTLSLVLTLALAWPLVYYFATVGIRVFGRGGVTAFGMALTDPVFHAAIGPWLFGDAALLCYLATIVASLYPAWFATRLNPAEALRVAG